MPVETLWNLEKSEIEYQGRKLKFISKTRRTKTKNLHRFCISSSSEECLTLITVLKKNHNDIILPSTAVLQPEGIFLFGKRKFGESKGSPEWHGAWPAVKPIFVGFIPMPK
ncbi:MAG TPA: hypothetical protein VJB34_10115 [Bdellovibrionota bacterium]|nr:hypothetical protein [Bdellovibrionota bacterium]